MRGFCDTFSVTNSMPPRCERHDKQMVLSIYARPLSPPGNTWVCLDCVREREEAEAAKKTRFPEGAEL
jgi:hypothetical protein